MLSEKHKLVSLYSTATFLFFLLINANADGVSKLPKNGTLKSSNQNDTLIIDARLEQIPGTFQANDLYNYVFIMKYKVLSVKKGSYSAKEILVGHYNPLIPRSNIKDKMDRYVDGNLKKFEIGAIHSLVLIKPISSVWKDAINDDYFDSNLDKYFSLTADLITK